MTCTVRSVNSKDSDDTKKEPKTEWTGTECLTPSLALPMREFFNHPQLAH
jgi:hypothetical protein